MLISKGLKKAAYVTEINILYPLFLVCSFFFSFTKRTLFRIHLLLSLSRVAESRKPKKFKFHWLKCIVEPSEICVEEVSFEW